MWLSEPWMGYSVHAQLFLGGTKICGSVLIAPGLDIGLRVDMNTVGNV